MMTARSALPVDELARLKRGLSACTTLKQSLDVALDTVIDVHRADFGNIQIYRAGALLLAVHRGFKAPFLETFRRVSVDDDSACGRAMREGRSIIVPDVERDAGYAPFRAAAAAAGFRAVQSTPMVGSNGLFVGMISTHFARPHRPTDEQMTILDFYAAEVADTIQKFQAAEILNGDGSWDAS